MSSVNQSSSSERRQQYPNEGAVPPSVPYHFTQPESLGSCTMLDMSDERGTMFDFAAPVPLDNDSVSGPSVPLARADSEPSTSLGPLAQLAKTGSGKWECPTCMVFNKLSHNRCVACECPQPKVKEAAGTVAMKPNQSSTAAPGDFKALVQQQTSGKWECSTCLTRNDEASVRCACCEAPKTF